MYTVTVVIESREETYPIEETYDCKTRDGVRATLNNIGNLFESYDIDWYDLDDEDED